MFKTFFITRPPENEVDIELERTMQLIHDRMERMLASQEAERLNFSLMKSTSAYYR